ncbi:MAG: Lrp/AsnC family transcriptional regulator [Planctomycetota bacterium]
MDVTDRQIVEILQDNARISNADIARRLEMAPSAILQRIRKLEERGVIRSYRAHVDPDEVERGFIAFVSLKTEEPLGDPAVAHALAEMPEVLELHDIAGEDCYLAKVRVADAAALHELLRMRIAQIPHVRSTSTIVVLKTFKESCVLPLPDDPD